MYYETSLFKKGNKMKFFSRLVLIFALLLIISALLFCIFIQSSYATKPIEKMLSSYTDQEIIIGNIEYNVKYPETIVFQNVKIGNFFYANKIYVDVDYSELLNKNLYINELNIVDSKINIQGLNKFQLTKPLNNLFIKQGLLKNIIFEDEDLKIDNSIIEVKNLLLIKDKKFDNNPSISMALHTPKIKYKDTEIQSLDIIAKYDKAHNLYKVNELKFDFKDGNVATNFIINEQTKSINIFNLNISNVDNLENILINQAANLPRLLSDWNFTIHEGKISDSSYYNPHNKLGLSNIDLQLDQISINKGNVTDLRFNSTVEKANIKNITLNDLSITYNHFNKKNDISSIFDGGQEKSLARNGFPCVRAGSAIDKGLGPFHFAPSPAYLEQGSDDCTDHVPEEAVGPDGEHEVVVFSGRVAHLRDVCRDIGLPQRHGNFADRCAVVAAGLLETGKIVPPQKRPGCEVHPADVHREGPEQ